MTGVFIDLETGGLDPKLCAVTQIAAVAFTMSPGLCDLHDTFNALICPDPELYFCQRALTVQGRDLPDLRGAGAEKDVYDEFCGFCRRHGSGGLWAHHAPFDEAFLSAVADRTGLPGPARGQVRCSKQLAGILISAGLLPGLTKTSLKALAERFGLRQPEPHDALTDAATGGRVLQCLLVAAGWMEGEG